MVDNVDAGFSLFSSTHLNRFFHCLQIYNDCFLTFAPAQLEQSSFYTDQHLLQLIAEGDEAAFRQLYERYAAKVFSIAFIYLKSHSAAQDAVQDIFLKVWTKREGLTAVENFNGWLQFVTRNLVIDNLRKKANEDKLPVQSATELPAAEKLIAGKEIAAVIDKAIQNLPPRQKEVYLLAREEGLKHHEIAERLSLSRSTVKEHIRQALKNIRSYLQHNLGVLLLFIIQHFK